MKRYSCYASVLLFLAGSATTPVLSAVSPSPVGMSILQGETNFAGVQLPVVLQTTTGYSPPFRLGKVEVVDGEVQIEVLFPEATRVVEPYEATLVTRLPPLEVGRWPVKAVAVQGDTRQLVAYSEVRIDAQGVQLTYAGAAEPTSADEIVVMLDRQPTGELEIERGPGVLRLEGQGLVRWLPAPAGYPVSLGKLPAGEWRIELLATREGIHDQLVLDVLPAPAAPQPIVLAGSFELSASWRNATGETGPAKLVQAPSADSALLYFFAPDNWELMVKVLDGCAINEHYWVFAAASTDVGYTIDIERQESTQRFEVENPVGTAAPAITNITAFPCDPAAP